VWHIYETSPLNGVNICCVQGVFDKRPNMAIDLPYLEEAWHHIFGKPNLVQMAVTSSRRWALGRGLVGSGPWAVRVARSSAWPLALVRSQKTKRRVPVRLQPSLPPTHPLLHPPARVTSYRRAIPPAGRRRRCCIASTFRISVSSWRVGAGGRHRPRIQCACARHEVYVLVLADTASILPTRWRAC
jgi:hypothetical protein